MRQVQKTLPQKLSRQHLRGRSNCRQYLQPASQSTRGPLCGIFGKPWKYACAHNYLRTTFVLSEISETSDYPMSKLTQHDD